MYERLKKGDIVWVKPIRAAGEVIEDMGDGLYSVSVATVDEKYSVLTLRKDSLGDIPADAVVGENSREQFYINNFGPYFSGILHSAEEAICTYESCSGRNPDYRREELRAALCIFVHVLWSYMYSERGDGKHITDAAKDLRLLVERYTGIKPEEL